MALKNPLLIVLLLKSDQCLSQLFDRGKGFDPQQILFEQANKVFGTAVAFGFTDERRRRSDAEKVQFLLEMIDM